MLPDVKAMLEAHSQLNPTGQGRRKLGHITKGGVMLLCAAWELYLEEVLLECAGHLIRCAHSPDDLPKASQKRIAGIVRDDINELGPLKLGGEGWKIVFLDGLRLKLERFNTPKSGAIDELFQSWIGKKDLSACWQHGAAIINEFVSTRGEIAHRGADATYVTRVKLDQFRIRISDTVKETDDCLAEYLKHETCVAKFPWRRTHLHA
ncbi:HEPN domain-containing protein [Roseicyclus amphidinii]|uniref:HEPN domain-containing protein n=1 Tax=Roseicyclus amphidinii TaxID=3034232 RepID=UPI0024E1031D|nr:HEPN domain-containing protein [Roseicyclus sp. Amp-Y-6]